MDRSAVAVASCGAERCRGAVRFRAERSAEWTCLLVDGESISVGAQQSATDGFS